MRRVLPPVQQSAITTTTRILMAHSEKFVNTIEFARLVTQSASIQKSNFEMAIIHKISILISLSSSSILHYHSYLTLQIILYCCLIKSTKLRKHKLAGAFLILAGTWPASHPRKVPSIHGSWVNTLPSWYSGAKFFNS
jgi:hypothetical protein